MGDILGDLKDLGKKISDFFKGLSQLKDRMEKVINSGKLASIGVGHGVEAVGKSFWMTTTDIGDLIWLIGRFTYQWLMCLVALTKELRTCFIFYLADLIGQTLYLVVPISVFLIKHVSGINLEEEVLYMNMLVEKADQEVYDLLGFHFAHFPDSVIQTCYTCPNGFKVRDSLDQIVDRAYKTDYDFNVAIPEMYNLPKRELKQAQSDFNAAVRPQ